MKKRTSLEELIEWITLGEGGYSTNDIIEKCLSLLPKERKQICSAFDRGTNDTGELKPVKFSSGKDYYNQTYNIK